MKYFLFFYYNDIAFNPYSVLTPPGDFLHFYYINNLLTLTVSYIFRKNYLKSIILLFYNG